MRISDWSSDVCSSDLDNSRCYRLSEAERVAHGDDVVADLQQVRVAQGQSHEVVGRDLDDGDVRPRVRTDLPTLQAATVAHGDGDLVSLLPHVVVGKLGRASCRERVCQYVLISG